MRLYFLYDDRARTLGTEESTVLSVGESLEEARDLADDYKPCSIYSYESAGDGALSDERWEEDIQ